MTKQLSILSQDEINNLYSLPKFDPESRANYFQLNEQETAAMKQYGRALTRLYFILQLGYFKAKTQFFVFDLEEVSSDSRYVSKHYFPEHILRLQGRISKPTRLMQQQVILTISGYKVADKKIRKALLDKAEKLARIHSKPIYIFREIMNYLEQQKILLPGYSVMQKHIIAQGLIHERQRLEAFIDKHLSQEDSERLENLLENKSMGIYLLTYLQQEPNSFMYYQMRSQMLRKKHMKQIHELAQKLIPKMEISNENIRYYSSLAGHYSVYKLNRMKRKMVYIYLICFAYSRYRHINDSMVEAFKHYVRSYETEAEAWSKQSIYTYQLEGMKQLSKVPQILKLFTDQKIEDSLHFGLVRKKAFKILAKNFFLTLSDYITKNSLDKKELKWVFYESIPRQISLNLRSLFMNLHFEALAGHTHLLNATKKLKELLSKSKPLTKVSPELFPCQFIAPHLKKYLYKNGILQVKRYEFLLLRSLRNKIESGDIFIPESFGFKSFDQDLISKSYWEANKTDIIARLDLPKLKQSPKEILSELESKLEQKFKKVNDAILKGKNEYVKITGQKADGSHKWQLDYPKISDKVNHSFFDQFSSIPIASLMDWVDQQTGFLAQFSHILGKNVSQKIPKHQLIASILALGTNHGVGKMGQISDLTSQQLRTARSNFLRAETLEKANIKIVNATSRLPMFKYYNIEEDVVHSSSDGQKFKTQFHTFNSRYSPKYFGLGKGISDYTLVANHIPVNARIIGAHEHESYFVFDLLFNNQTQIQPEIHSTDTDGTNQVNFAILDFFGYQFAPRYKSISSKAKILYTFKHPNQYDQGYLLKSTRKIKLKLIEEEWDNIQRIIASLALKTTTQSTIIKKLAAYARNNRTRKALVEYDKILKTIYLLEYIDSPSLRRNVQKALNRGEEYHQLKRHIFYVHGGKFRVHTMQEQQLIADCTHLIANVIIYYNTWLLSQNLSKNQKGGDEIEIEKIKKIAPVAWQHVNVYGTYKFTTMEFPLEFEQILENATAP
ncbi:MAG: Tn3 family transposase [Bacteroidota bacterium]